jgi:glycosyltransferase involved in cell wall biosynthesis
MVKSNIIVPGGPTPADRKKILFVDKIGSFLPALQEAANNIGLLAHHAEGRINPEALMQYGTIWCSWGDELAVQLSHMMDRLPGKLVVQVRSYEAYQDQFMKNMKWENVNCLVYVADHIAQRIMRVMGWEGGEVPEWLNTALLPTCLDLKKWPKPKKWQKKANQIAWVGRHCAPKNPELLVFLAQNDPNYKFVAIGPFPDGRFKDFCDYTQRSIGNITFLDNTNPKFWEETDIVRETLEESSYILSTSTHESTHMALMEGMAMGCKPLVYDRLGNWVDENWVFKTMEEFHTAMFGGTHPDEYRDFIKTHRNIDIHHQCFTNIWRNLHDPPAAFKNTGDTPDPGIEGPATAQAQ